MPLRGQISYVAGRRSQGGKPGSPAIDQLAIDLADGTRLEFGPPHSGEAGSLEPLAPIYAASFLSQPGSEAICPICRENPPLHREHVPQGPLGGHVMTMTCQSCNNLLGSRIEPELEGWFDSSMVDVGVEHDGEVRGRRHAPKVYYQKAPDGAFSFLFDGEVSPEIRQMFAGGSWRMRWREPDERRWRLALLKHAYLAACLELGTVPQTDEADTIRDDLIIGRDAPKRSRLPESRAAEGLSVYRSGVGPQGTALALVRTRPGGEVEAELLISLAGVLFVSWPFAATPPRGRRWLLPVPW